MKPRRSKKKKDAGVCLPSRVLQTKLHLFQVIWLLHILRYHPLHPLLPVRPILMSIFFWNMDKMGSIQHSQPKNIYLCSPET